MQRALRAIEIGDEVADDKEGDEAAADLCDRIGFERVHGIRPFMPEPLLGRMVPELALTKPRPDDGLCCDSRGNIRLCARRMAPIRKKWCSVNRNLSYTL